MTQIQLFYELIIDASWPNFFNLHLYEGGYPDSTETVTCCYLQMRITPTLGYLSLLSFIVEKFGPQRVFS